MGTSSTLSKAGTFKPKKESKKEKNGKLCISLCNLTVDVYSFINLFT